MVPTAGDGNDRRLTASPDREPPPPPGSPVEQDLVARLGQALETGDVDGVIALLTDDVWLTMPPVPLEYQGRDLAARFHRAVTFRHGRSYKLVAARANGQPAFGVYVDDPHTGTAVFVAPTRMYSSPA